MTTEKIIHFEEDIDRLLCILPKAIQSYLKTHDLLNELYEVVLDIGHPPSIRFDGQHERLTKFSDVVQDDIDYVIKRYSKCISKSTDNFLDWLTQDYKKRLRTNIRTNFETIKNKK